MPYFIALTVALLLVTSAADADASAKFKRADFLNCYALARHFGDEARAGGLIVTHYRLEGSAKGFLHIARKLDRADGKTDEETTNDALWFLKQYSLMYRLPVWLQFFDTHCAIVEQYGMAIQSTVIPTKK